MVAIALGQIYIWLEGLDQNAIFRSTPGLLIIIRPIKYLIFSKCGDTDMRQITVNWDREDLNPDQQDGTIKVANLVQTVLRGMSKPQVIEM